MCFAYAFQWVSGSVLTITEYLRSFLQRLMHIGNRMLQKDMCSAHETVKLSALDQIPPRRYTPFPLIFAIEPNEVAAALSILQQGFEQLTHDIPLLGGYLCHATRKGEVVIKVPHSRPELLIQDFSTDTGGFDSRYLPIAGVPPASDKIPLFAAQVNIVQGKIIVCICMHHALMDATAAASVIGRWAQWCRAISMNSIAAPLEKGCLDRSLLVNGGQKNEEISLPSYIMGDAAAEEHERILPSVSERPKIIGKCFRINRHEISRLKDEIINFLRNNGSSGTWVSTNDTLCAVLWQAIVRARIDSRPRSEERCSRLKIPVNVRRKMVPPLPEGYIGNAVVDAKTDKSMAELAVWSISQLAHTAFAIRQAIASVNDKYVRALISAIDELDDISNVRANHERYLNDDVVITSWLHLGLCDMDWGGMLGMIEDSTPRWDGIDGICCILPRRRDGSVKLMIGLELGCMEKLESDKEFQRYADVVSA